MEAWLYMATVNPTLHFQIPASLQKKMLSGYVPTVNPILFMVNIAIPLLKSHGTMPKHFVNGKAKQPVRLFAFPLKRNGNMLPATLGN